MAGLDDVSPVVYFFGPENSYDLTMPFTDSAGDP